MSRDDTEVHRTTATSLARVWRTGEHRSVVGGCLRAAFAPTSAALHDADLERLLRMIDGFDQDNVIR